MILVVGSTGLLGSEICRGLSTFGVPVRGLVRQTSDPCKVEALKAMGAETVLGDLRDKPSLVSACQGMEYVISTATTTTTSSQGIRFLSPTSMGNSTW